MSQVLLKNGVLLIESLEIAGSFRARMTGLIGRRALLPGSALLIPSCGSVHTFFMRFSLDLAFLDGDGRVVRLVRNVPPFRIVFGGMRAMTTIEFAAGWLKEDAIQPGDIVTLSGEGHPRKGTSPTGSRIS